MVVLTKVSRETPGGSPLANSPPAQKKHGSSPCVMAGTWVS